MGSSPGSPLDIASESLPGIASGKLSEIVSGSKLTISSKALQGFLRPPTVIHLETISETPSAIPSGSASGNLSGSTLGIPFRKSSGKSRESLQGFLSGSSRDSIMPYRDSFGDGFLWKVIQGFLWEVLQGLQKVSHPSIILESPSYILSERSPGILQRSFSWIPPGSF